MSLLSIDNTSIRQIDGLYCLNDLHKAAGAEDKHQPSNFIRNERTLSLIDEIQRCSDMSNAISDSSNMRNPMTSKQGQGTYVSKELVYAYAMWVSAKFHLHVIRAFDANLALAPPSSTEKKLTQALLKARPEFNQVSQYLNKQLSVREIALLLQISQTKVSHIKVDMVECGLLEAKQSVKTPLIFIEKEQIKHLHHEGKSFAQISTITGRSESCVRRFIKREEQS